MLFDSGCSCLRYASRTKPLVTLATAERPGDGPALVLMHGLGDSRKAFDKVLPLLPGWRVVTVDLRGHGDSATAPWSWPDAVDDLHEVIERYDLMAPFVGGHSLGGMVALQYALAGHPAQASSTSTAGDPACRSATSTRTPPR